MINNFIPTIGLEIHCSLNTKSKMFSDSKSCHNDKPNTNISFLDLALPGVLPTVNKEAVKKGIVLANTLGMEIDKILMFDRKNYFYQDLPKGFQITQQYHPIGRNGSIKLDDGTVINIERIHLEEDTAKEQTINGKTYLDYNRAGMPLIEIVCRHDIHSAQQAVEFLTKLKRNLVFMDVSNGKMEDGSLRVDVNISVAPVGSKKLGERVEIKNINSFANVAKAINYEISRQIGMILKNQEIENCTRRWDETKNQTIFMRQKDTQIEYNYFAEPNICPILLEDDFIDNILQHLNKTPNEIAAELKSKNLKSELIEQLLNDYELYKVFNSIETKVNDINLVVSWIMVELVGYLKNNNLQTTNINENHINLVVKLLKLLKSGDINGKQAKIIFPEMIKHQKDPSVIMKEKNLVQIKDEKVLEGILNKIIDQNIKMLDQFENREERVLKYFLGMLMKETKSQANPNIANNVLNKLIKNRLKK